MNAKLVYGLIVVIVWSVLGCTPTEYAESQSDDQVELVGRKQVERPVQPITLGDPEACDYTFSPSAWSQSTFTPSHTIIDDPLIVPIQQIKLDEMEVESKIIQSNLPTEQVTSAPNGKLAFVDTPHFPEVYMIDPVNLTTTKIVEREQYVKHDGINTASHAAYPKMRWSPTQEVAMLVNPAVGIELIDFSQSTSCLIQMQSLGSEVGRRIIRDVEWHPDGKQVAISAFRERTGKPVGQTYELFILDLEDKHISYIAGRELPIISMLMVEWIPGTDQLIFESKITQRASREIDWDKSVIPYEQEWRALEMGAWGLYLLDVSDMSIQRIHDQFIYLSPTSNHNSKWYDDRTAGKTWLINCNGHICQFDFGFTLDE